MVEATVLTKVPGTVVPPIKLLVLASKAVGIAPNQRFRLEQWAPHLSGKHGVELEFAPFESPRLTEVLYRHGHFPEKAAWTLFDFVRRAGDVVKARKYDGVVIIREASLIGPAIYERALKALGMPIIFDFDDTIWCELPASGGQARNGIFSKLHFFGKTSTICRIASAVTPGNEFLAAYARERNDHVTVVPTTIELANYAPQPETPKEDPFVICWTGSTSTLAHFEFARPALELLAQRLPIEVKVICNEPPATPIAGAKNSFIRWSPDNEARDVGDCHVGIMPLPDNEITRGKCGLKALQYMATGRPVVVSPVGMNVDLVEHGVNGFLATTPKEYVDALLLLAGDAELRRKMGERARRTIEERYSAEVAAGLFARVVREALARAS